MAQELALNDDFLREAAGMVSAEDVSDVKSLPVLKINYDSDSTYPQGTWVLGQRKKDDAIIEEGVKVKGLVVLAVRNRYAYYVEDDTTKNCNSPLHMQGDTVFGSNYKQKCGKTCSYRAEGIDPRCQAQKVVFGLALTEDDKLVECVAYLKGSGYMPFAEYIEEMVKVKQGSKFITVPTFTFITLLSSKKAKKGTVTYWIPEFTRGPSFTIAQIKSFEEKRRFAQEYIESLNASIGAPRREDDDVTASTATTPRPATEIVNEVPLGVVNVGEETPPWETDASAAPADDIEAAIQAALGSMK